MKPKLAKLVHFTKFLRNVNYIEKCANFIWLKEMR